MSIHEFVNALALQQSMGKRPTSAHMNPVAAAGLVEAVCASWPPSMPPSLWVSVATWQKEQEGQRVAEMEKLKALAMGGGFVGTLFGIDIHSRTDQAEAVVFE